MASDWPKVDRAKRIPDDLRRDIGKRLVAAYEQGKSIRELCEETGYSIGRVRGLMESAGVEYRGRGGARKRSTAPS